MFAKITEESGTEKTSFGKDFRRLFLTPEVHKFLIIFFGPILQWAKVKFINY